MADEPKTTVEDTDADSPDTDLAEADDATVAEEPKGGKDKPKSKRDGDAEAEHSPEWYRTALKREVEKLRKETAKSVETAKREAAEAERKAIKEQQLLEKENFQELAKLKEAEAEEAKRKLREYERSIKLGKLLDKHEVHEPELRGLFERMTGDLEEIDETVAGVRELIERIVDKRTKRQVDEQLGSEPPPKKPKEAPPSDIHAQIAEAMKAGDWRKSLELKSKLSEEMAAKRR